MTEDPKDKDPILHFTIDGLYPSTGERVSRYCCEIMKEQLTHQCDIHGEGRSCPDVIVGLCEAQFHEGELMLIARNAEYKCNFCPWCGTKWE